MVSWRSGYEGLGGHLGTSLGGVWEVDSRVNSGSILDLFWTQSEKPHRWVRNCLHLAVGRVLNLIYTVYGTLGMGWVGTGIAPLQTHPAPHYPGYTPPLPPGSVPLPAVRAEQ